MADVTRRIGLSLGADLCWPICYEEVLRRLDLALPIDGDTVRFETDRVTIEPFDLRQPTSYDLVVDRLTHWYTTSREWIKKAILTDGLYVFNNPWAIQSMEKHTSYCAMIRLGMPIPDDVDGAAEALRAQAPTWRSRSPATPGCSTSARSASYVGYPLFVKPYDGGGWAGVSRVDDGEAAAPGLRRERYLPVAPATGRRAARPVHPLHRLRPADPTRALRPVGAAARSLHDRRRRRPRRPAPDARSTRR